MKQKEEMMTDDFDIEGFIDEEYSEEPTDEAPKEAPAEETPAEETPAKEEVKDPSDNAVLPPGFDAEETPKGEETPAEEIELEEIDAAIEAETNENKKSNMARMRTKMAAQADRLAAFEAKKTEDPADVSEYEKQLEEANNKIAALDLKEDPRFKMRYDQKITETLTGITSLLKEHFDGEGEAQAVVSRLANLTPVNRNKFMIENDVPEHYRMELVSRFHEADVVWGDRNSALQNFEESRKSLDMEATVQDQNQTAEIREAVFKESTTALQSNESLLNPQPDNLEYNAFVTENHNRARAVVESNDPKLQTRMMIQGSLMPTYKAMFELTQKQLVEAKAELARHTGGKPDFNGGAAVSGKGDVKLPDDNDSLADMIVNS